MIEILFLFIYSIPTMLALQKKNVLAIFALNLFLGWTFLGWVIALIWSLTNEK